MILAEATSWLEEPIKKGLQVSDEVSGNLEVSFMLSYAGEGLTDLPTKH